MTNIIMSPEAQQRIHELLSEEEGNPCVRIQEFKVGTG